MTKFNIEFQNCALEINYLETEEQIALQKVVESIGNISETFEDIRKGVIKVCEALANFFRPVFNELLKETDIYLRSGNLDNTR